MPIASPNIGHTGHGEQRRGQKFTDQFGRKWFAQVEKETNAPTCAIRPMGGWRERIPTPQQYILQHPEDHTRFEINLTAWKRDLQNRESEWLQQLLRVGQEFHGQAFDEQAPTMRSLLEVGTKPMPWQLVSAMEQGNAYALGMSDVVDERVEAYLTQWRAGADRKRSAIQEPNFGPVVETDAPKTKKTPQEKVA